MIGEARFTYTNADMIAMQYAWWTGAARWQSFLLTWAIILTAYLVLFAGIAVATGQKDGFEAVKVALVLAPVVTVALFGVGLVLVPVLGRRALRENRLIGGEYHWSWDETALHIDSERGHVNIPWGLLAGWLDAPKVVLLYQSRRLVFTLPKRALAVGEVDRLVALLREQSVRERKRFGLIAAPARRLEQP